MYKRFALITAGVGAFGNPPSPLQNGQVEGFKSKYWFAGPVLPLQKNKTQLQLFFPFLTSDRLAGGPKVDPRGQFQGDIRTSGGKGFPIGMFIITSCIEKSKPQNISQHAAKMFHNLSGIIVKA